MTMRSGFFNSISGDRKYDAARFAEYFSSFIGNGIFPEPEQGLKINSNNNMTVAVQVGKAWINGYFFVNDDVYILKIDNADGILNRIDRIVARYDVTDREIRLQVKKGAFASIPVAPELQRDADAYELGLADVCITAGATSIAQSSITDLRSNAKYCGIVDSLIAGNVNLLSDRIDDIENGTTAVQNAVVAERATKLQTARNINGTAFDGTKDITIVDNTKAPTNHASTGTGYGIGDSTTYGHLKLSSSISDSSGYGSGIAATPLAVKTVNDKLKYTVETITSSRSWTIPAGVTAIDVLKIDGGDGGEGGGAGVAYGSSTEMGGEGGYGGKSGKASFGRFPVTPQSVLNIVIGAGGTGSAGNTNNTSSRLGGKGGETKISDISFLDVIEVMPGGWDADSVDSNNNGLSGKTAKLHFKNNINLSSGGNGGEGYSWQSSNKPPGVGGNGGTGAGNGGNGGQSNKVGTAGTNAAVYGCGGGGGGGAGGTANTNPINNTSAKGGNGMQGVVYIGYYGF